MKRRKGLGIIVALTFICLSTGTGFCTDKNSPPAYADSGDESTAEQGENLSERLKSIELKLEAQEKIMLAEEQILADQGSLLNTMINEGKLPEWVKKVKLSGDFRLRYQSDMFGQDNPELLKPDDPRTIMNTQEDRDRLRIRFRLGLTAKVNDRMEIGARLTTGNEKEPVSTNETLGDYSNKDGLVIDRAYLQIRPVNRAAFWFGRMPNPFDSTDLVWDKDLNLEGLALTATANDPKALVEKNWDLSVTAGFFPLQELEYFSDDKYLYGGQIGAKYKPVTALGLKLAVAYYDYRNIEGKFNDPAGPGDETDYTLPAFQQKGNTLFNINTKMNDKGEIAKKLALASDFNQLDINSSIEIAIKTIAVQLMADYVKNLGFDKDKVRERTGVEVPEETEGYQVGVAVGHREVKDLWQWNGSLSFRHLEADAVIDAFTDSDFHLGGTNAEGWILGVQLGVGKNAWLSFNWLTADEIGGPPLAVDVMQIDLNAAF
ncbi:MAG: putative porin [bacterium]